MSAKYDWHEYANLGIVAHTHRKMHLSNAMAGASWESALGRYTALSASLRQDLRAAMPAKAFALALQKAVEIDGPSSLRTKRGVVQTDLAQQIVAAHTLLRWDFADFLEVNFETKEGVLHAVYTAHNKTAADGFKLQELYNTATCRT